MLSEVTQLAEQIGRSYPSSDPKLTTFPSGAVMLDVKIGPEIYVMEYLPSIGGIGISRMSTATFGWEGFENAFDTFEEAKSFLLHLLSESAIAVSSKAV
jgi:hypothetical protein